MSLSRRLRSNRRARPADGHPKIHCCARRSACAPSGGEAAHEKSPLRSERNRAAFVHDQRRALRVRTAVRAIDWYTGQSLGSAAARSIVGDTRASVVLTDPPSNTTTAATTTRGGSGRGPAATAQSAIVWNRGG